MIFNHRSFYRILFLVCLLVPALWLTSCSGDDDDDITPPGGPAELSITRDGAEVDALQFTEHGGNVMLALVANVSWEVSVSDNSGWLSLSCLSGGPTTSKNPGKEHESRYIAVSAEPMAGEPSRTCTLTFRAADMSKTITVTQTQPSAPDESGWETAVAANRNMASGSGINLFNTLDAVGNWFDQDDVYAFETCWGQAVTTQGWFDAVAAAGFRAVRIPVTWHPHMDDNWIIKEPWINRVEEVVNYALNSGLYCILNVHHDTGNDGWLCADIKNIDEIADKFGRLWTQIATRFNKYDHRLLFEGYNEMLDGENSWVEPVAGGYEAVNILAQKFVDSVRATGGNNRHRNLVINTYGGGGSKSRFDNLVLPKDLMNGHLLVEVHNYTPADFSNLFGTLNDLADDKMPEWTAAFETMLRDELDVIIDYSKKTGVPMIIGECGAYERIPDAEKAKFGRFITTYSDGKADISVFFWGQLIDRTTYQPLYPEFIKAFTKSAD